MTSRIDYNDFLFQIHTQTTKTILLACLWVLLLGSGLGVSLAATIITVDTSEDLADSGNFDNHTCTYTSGAIYFPAADGKCTLRRATLEAGVRPDADRPISIQFNLPINDPKYDASLDIWEVQIDESHPWEMSRRFITDDGGQITIDGNSQTGGRTDGPKIMINTNRDNLATGGRSLEIRTSNNIIRNLGFHGGGQVILYEASNLVENLWMGLSNDGTKLQLATTATTQGMRAMARGGIIMPGADSDNNTIRNNRIIGAFERAIRVTSGGMGNLIENNFIGMNATGAVPLNGSATINCNRNSDYDPAFWYGGDGIQVTGSSNIIQNNILAGLHRTQTANETPAIAMEIAGSDNSIQGNIIGRDAMGATIGVCGQGLLLQGTASIVTENIFYFTRNGFEPNDIGSDFDSAIITQSFTGQGNGDPDRWLKVWNNIIDGGNYNEANYHAYRFAGPGVPEAMRKFIPAKVTSFNGTAISGTNGDPLPQGPATFCPHCTIYLYLDDTDDRIESFELLGTAMADATGNWSTSLSRALTTEEGIRTQSMSNAMDVMHIYDANTTTRLSDDLYKPAGQSDLVYIPLDSPCRVVNTGGSGLPFNENRSEQAFLAWGDTTLLNQQRDLDGSDNLGACLPENGLTPSAIAANVTVAAKSSKAKGNVVAYPFDSAAPTASLVNFLANNIANSSIITLSPASSKHFKVKAAINGFNPGGSKQANVIIDILGYFYPGDLLAATANPGLSYIPLPLPCRIVNTRNINRPFHWLDQTRQGFLAWGTALELDGQRDGDGSKNLGACLPEGGMKPAAMVANVTVAAKSFKAKGNVVAFKHEANATAPTASLVNFSANNIANASIISLDPDAQQHHFDIEAQIRNNEAGGSKEAHVIVDAMGYFYSQDELSAAAKSGLGYIPLAQPCRIIDTRGVNQAFNESNNKTQGFRGWGTTGQLNSQRDQDGSDGLGACEPETGMTPSAMVANITVAAKGFKSKGNVTAYPSGGDVPQSSLVNFQANNIANSSIVALNPNNASHFNIEANIFSHDTGGSKQVHVIVDVLGYFYP